MRAACDALPPIADHPQLGPLLVRALEEDIGTGDATTLSLVPDDAHIEGRIICREACVSSGATVAAAVFAALAPGIPCEPCVAEGARVKAGCTLMKVNGAARAILTGERTALNLMQRMCGIATLTRSFVDAVAGYDVAILDTRKTTPGLRFLEKYAVRCGGGQNHRMGLYDRVMIKDNHRLLWEGGDSTRLDHAVLAAREAFPGIAVEVEVENEDELQSALKAVPEWILLDNMSPEQMARCVEMVGGRSLLEASGGISLTTVAAVAASGVDAISLGCLTHSAVATDLSMELEIS